MTIAVDIDTVVLASGALVSRVTGIAAPIVLLEKVCCGDVCDRGARFSSWGNGATGLTGVATGIVTADPLWLATCIPTEFGTRRLGLKVGVVARKVGTDCCLAGRLSIGTSFRLARSVAG